MNDLGSTEEYLEELKKLSSGERLAHKLWCKAYVKKLRKELGIANPHRLKHGKKK